MNNPAEVQFGLQTQCSFFAALLEIVCLPLHVRHACHGVTCMMDIMASTH